MTIFTSWLYTFVFDLYVLKSTAVYDDFEKPRFAQKFSLFLWRQPQQLPTSMSSPFVFLLAQKRSLGKMLCLLKGFSINEEETLWKFSQLGWYSWDITLLPCRWDNKDAIREFSQWGDRHCSNKTLNKTLKSMDKCKRKRCVKLAVIWQWYNTQHTLKNNIKKIENAVKIRNKWC